MARRNRAAWLGAVLACLAAGGGAVQADNVRPPSVIGAEPAAVTKPVSGFDDNQRALIGRVNAYLSGINTLVGNFVQVGPDRSRTEGTFYLLKPGRIRFEYNPPSPIELVADGQSVVVRDRKLATQDLYPLSQTPLRFLLAERIDLAKDTNLIAVHADDTFVTVAIEERQTLGGSHRLMLMFGAKDFQLKQWVVTDPQGYDTTIAVSNLNSTKRPDPALFRIDYTDYRN
jgi:outer membrane lipoprotein-sorting protein